jgi:hypothetical protein
MKMLAAVFATHICTYAVMPRDRPTQQGYAAEWLSMLDLADSTSGCHRSRTGCGAGLAARNGVPVLRFVQRLGSRPSAF